MKGSVNRVFRRIGRKFWLLLGIVFVWNLWVFNSAFISHYDLEFTSPYLVAPITLVVGLSVGAFIGRQWLQGKVVYLFVVPSIAIVISLPIYANASAAVGGLMIALAGLGTVGLRDTLQTTQSLVVTRRTSAADVHLLSQAVVLAFTLFAGVFLVLDAQAATILTVPVVCVAVFAIWKLSGPSQWIVILLALVVAAAAVLVVVFLGIRASWPPWLSDSESLSSVRHILWSDALRLWATAPLVGSGPGSFTSSSELASSVPSLAAVHSLPLQVGAELGTLGVLLLAGLFLAGALFAARGSRPVAFIAIAAWTALAVHSSIDHLEDFPIVAFMGGVVLGWSGFDTQSSEASCRTENTVG